MAKLGKRTTAAREAFVGKENLTVEEAVSLIKANANAKFDETLEIALNLGVDPRHADQMVRGVVGLPNGTGKDVRVAVFARGPKADEAKAAGADIVGAEDLMESFGLRKIASLFLRQKGSIQRKVSDTAYLAQLPMDAQIRPGRRMELSALIEEETTSVDIRYIH